MPVWEVTHMNGAWTGTGLDGVVEENEKNEDL